MKICYYGDDFTGSTDALEALTTGGMRVILFLDIPDPQLWQKKFSHYDGFGVAGVSRTMSPEQMEQTLRPVFEKLKPFGAAVTHYKVCSTFDSSPEVGSIGKVIDIGRDVFSEQRYTPLLAGSPPLKRYTVFGNHFTSLKDETIRLDRHPNMSKHPITPMNEADLRLHLAKQTKQSTALVDILDLEHDGDELKAKYEARLEGQPNILLFDILTPDHLPKIGRLLAQESEKAQVFAVGSSGIEYALTAHLKQIGELPAEPPVMQIDEVQPLLVLSGSCSPATQAQIEWSLANGYEGILIPAAALVGEGAEDLLPEVLGKAEALLRDNRKVILYTALGPEDPSIEETAALLKAQGYTRAESGKLIGSRLGQIAKHLIASTGIKRIVFAGGDTSGFAVSEMNVYALEMAAPLVPGGPVCRVYSEDQTIDGLEIVLKGGQVGPPQFFEQVRKGRVE